MDRKQSLELEFAGIRIRLEGMLPGDPGVLADFAAVFPEPMHEYTVALCDALEPPRGREIFRAANQCAYLAPEGVTRYTGPVERDVKAAQACIRRTGDDAQICILRGPDVQSVTLRALVNHLDLEHLLTIHDGFILHASYIEWDRKAILFTAPSETGKSTQAKLWCDHMGAELVNGDRAAVRIFPDGVKACGLPFSGSSPVRRNVTLPLGAIVYLSQAKENRITRLRGVRAFRAVWEGCTVNVWDREDVEKATKTVSEVLGRVPVYHLACTPDERAVKLLYDALEAEV